MLMGSLDVCIHRHVLHVFFGLYSLLSDKFQAACALLQHGQMMQNALRLCGQIKYDLL